MVLCRTSWGGVVVVCLRCGRFCFLGGGFLIIWFCFWLGLFAGLVVDWCVWVVHWLVDCHDCDWCGFLIEGFAVLCIFVVRLVLGFRVFWISGFWVGWV